MVSQARPCLGGQHVVQLVRVVAQGHARARLEALDLDAGVQVHHVLAIRVHLDEDLVLTHHLRNGRGGVEWAGGAAEGTERRRTRKRTLTTSPTWDPGCCSSCSSSRNERTFELRSLRCACSLRRFCRRSRTCKRETRRAKPCRCDALDTLMQPTAHREIAMRVSREREGARDGLRARAAEGSLALPSSEDGRAQRGRRRISALQVSRHSPAALAARFSTDSTRRAPPRPESPSRSCPP